MSEQVGDYLTDNGVPVYTTYGMWVLSQLGAHDLSLIMVCSAVVNVES